MDGLERYETMLRKEATLSAAERAALHAWDQTHVEPTNRRNGSMRRTYVTIGNMNSHTPQSIPDTGGSDKTR